MKVRRNWKVIVWVEVIGAKERFYGRGAARYRAIPTEKQMVFAQRAAAEAWRIFWHFHHKDHVIQGPELWQGKRLVMGLGGATKCLLKLGVNNDRKM